MPCIVKDCQRIAAEDETEMCSSHWRQVPADLKKEIWACWKEALNKGCGADARLQDLRDMARAYVGRRDGK